MLRKWSLGLLIRRVWRIGAQGRLDTLCGEYMPESRRLLRNVIRIIIESGLLYSTSALITFITFVCKSNAIYVITGAVSISIIIWFSALHWYIFYYTGDPNCWNCVQPHHYQGSDSIQEERDSPSWKSLLHALTSPTWSSYCAAGSSYVRYKNRDGFVQFVTLGHYVHSLI